MQTLILCQVKGCSYNIFAKDKVEAYQHQCGQDQIDVEMGSDGIPQCFSYDPIDT